MSWPQNYGGGNPGNYLGGGGQQNPQLTQRGAKQYVEDYYVYSVNIPILLTLASNIQTITIQADSDFEWVMSTVSGNVNGQSEPSPDSIIIPITVLITDSGSGRQLMSAPVPVTTIAGTGKQPFINPIVRTFKAKSSVTLSFTSYSASTWNNVFFDLIGRKLFDVTQ